MTEHSVRPDGSGYRLQHDPAIAEAYRPWRLGSVVLWHWWDRVRCPTLVLRGALSDMLLASTAAKMTRRGPHAALVEFPDRGHVPTLVHQPHVVPVLEFLGSA
jgi:pimeloyl-ACP methyl ester carboxylesterase